MVGALIVTHGSLGEILVEEIERLMGPQDRFRAMSTHGLSANDISRLITERIEGESCIVFTDGPGTSPTLRACLAIRDDQAVVTGVNVSMLLSFVVHRDRLGVQELAERMVVDGKRSLEVLWPNDTNA